MVITARTVLMNPVKREYMTHSRSYRSNLLLTAVHSIVCSVNRPVQVKPIQGHHILITSIRISLLVSTQFSSGNVSHRWSKVAMLSLKPDKFNLLRWCQYSPWRVLHAQQRDMIHMWLIFYLYSLSFHLLFFFFFCPKEVRTEPCFIGYE